MFFLNIGFSVSEILKYVKSPITLVALLILLIAYLTYTLIKVNHSKQLVYYYKKDRLTALSKILKHQTATYLFAICICVWIVAQFIPTHPFDLTVLVREESSNKIPELHAGQIVLHLGSESARTAKINENGEATFIGIPTYYSGDSVLININNIEGEPYKAVCESCKYLLTPDKTITLKVKSNHLDRVHGYVQDVNGNPLSNATLRIQTLNATTDQTGYFLFDIPDSLQTTVQTIYVNKAGFNPQKTSVTPYTQTEPMQITLEKNAQKQ